MIGMMMTNIMEINTAIIIITLVIIIIITIIITLITIIYTSPNTKKCAPLDIQLTRVENLEASAIPFLVMDLLTELTRSASVNTLSESTLIN